jgi:magnesium-protoporphyrin O-methyltransferase
MSELASSSFRQRRGALTDYFDRTASETWARLTSDAPVSGIRQTVREGRDRMRATLLSWLPGSMTGLRLLDAGCGTGALSVEAAARGAEVLAVDVAASLLDVARGRLPAFLSGGSVGFLAGDMSDPALGSFDHVVAMDSLIHYEFNDIVAVLAGWAPRVRGSMAFTVAPRTPLLSVMHAAGKLFPRADRAPAIVPADIARLRDRIAATPELRGWRLGRDARVSGGFYTSHALELVRL